MTTRRLSVALFALVAGLTGCGKEVPTPGTVVDVAGAVTANGQPLAGVTVYFQPTGGAAQQVTFKAGPDGAFAGKMTAGKYAWYLSAPEDGKVTEAKKAEAALKAVPAAFRQPSMDRQIDVATGAKLQLDVK